VQLAGVAEGTVRVASRRSSLEEYPLHIADGREHVEALSRSVAAFAALVRQAIDRANECGDADTGDLFTEISREVDKELWLLEAHLQGRW